MTSARLSTPSRKLKRPMPWAKSATTNTMTNPYKVVEMPSKISTTTKSIALSVSIHKNPRQGTVADTTSNNGLRPQTSALTNWLTITHADLKPNDAPDELSSITSTHY